METKYLNSCLHFYIKYLTFSLLSGLSIEKRGSLLQLSSHLFLKRTKTNVYTYIVQSISERDDPSVASIRRHSGRSCHYNNCTTFPIIPHLIIFPLKTLSPYSTLRHQCTYFYTFIIITFLVLNLCFNTRIIDS